MKACALALLVAGLLTLHHASGAALVRQYGSSAPLRTLALSAHAPPAPAPPPLRRFTPRAPVTAQAGAAPLFPLPAELAVPALAHVRTGGSSFEIEGARAANGSVSGALGDMQYVQLANGQLSVYRKDDGALLLGPVPASALFADAPPGPATDACGMQRGDDTEVHYDQLANRWILSYRSWAQGAPYFQCIAVSASSDASGSYQRYALPMATHYFDDPHLAVWPDAYYLSVNLFDSVDGAYRGPRICGIDRQALLRGRDAVLRCRDLGETVAPLAPASLDGYASASAALFLALDLSTRKRLLLWRFSFSANRLAAPLALPVAPFAIACEDTIDCISQPAPGVRLALLGERLAPRPVFRNDDGRETLVAAHPVRIADGRLGVRWYEIADPYGAAQVAQQGSLAPDAISRWMGSIGMDKVGNIALGYSVASGDTPPGIRYTGRQRTDPPGRMQAEEVIFNGNGVQPDPSRLGRASGGLALDPIDGCTFWYTQRYLPSTGTANWRTRIASFKFENCR
ncbi:MAG: hypothetical protein V4484_10725 [Pseudomonadota bacterium]